MKHPPEHYEKERKRDKERWAAMPPEQKLNKTYKNNYGVTYAFVQELLENQEGRCDSCGDEIELGFNKGVLDHCHKTDTIRSLLCSHCNRALGFVFDSTERLEKLIRYLKKHDERVDKLPLSPTARLRNK